jgi:hypothetical protein
VLQFLLTWPPASIGFKPNCDHKREFKHTAPPSGIQGMADHKAVTRSGKELRIGDDIRASATRDDPSLEVIRPVGDGSQNHPVFKVSHPWYVTDYNKMKRKLPDGSVQFV